MFRFLLRALRVRTSRESFGFWCCCAKRRSYLYMRSCRCAADGQSRVKSYAGWSHEPEHRKKFECTLMHTHTERHAVAHMHTRLFVDVDMKGKREMCAYFPNKFQQESTSLCVLFPCTYNRHGPLDEFRLQVDEATPAAQWDTLDRTDWNTIVFLNLLLSDSLEKLI